MMDSISAFKTTQVMLTNEFEIYHYRETFFKPIDFHNHDFYELYFFLDGGVTYYIEDQVYELEPGELLVIPPGRMHRPVIFDSSAIYERMVLWINVDYLHTLEGGTGIVTKTLRLFNGTNGYLIHTNDEAFSFLLGIFRRLIPLAKETSPLASFQQKTLISALLGEICQKQEEPKNSPELPKKPELIPDVIRYINEHFTEPLKLDDICSVFFVSKYHLIRKFKEYTNTTVYHYILSKRIVLARHLIRQGITVTSVAEQCGFSDYSNFYKAFTAKVGMTPAQFKKYCGHEL